MTIDDVCRIQFENLQRQLNSLAERIQSLEDKLSKPDVEVEEKK